MQNPLAVDGSLGHKITTFILKLYKSDGVCSLAFSLRGDWLFLQTWNQNVRAHTVLWALRKWASTSLLHLPSHLFPYHNLPSTLSHWRIFPLSSLLRAPEDLRHLGL